MPRPDRRPTTVHHPLFCAYVLCMTYVTKSFLLASSSAWNKHYFDLCTVKAKKENKNHTIKLLFCTYTLCMNYVTKSFLLVSS